MKKGWQLAWELAPDPEAPLLKIRPPSRSAEATKPDDWDEEEDGEWEAPTIANPKCTTGPGCGEWKRPQKSNPEYKGGSAGRGRGRSSVCLDTHAALLLFSKRHAAEARCLHRSCLTLPLH